MAKRPFLDVWARSSDGLRLHARSYGDRGSPTVVCLPGLARHAADFHDLASALTDLDETVPRHVLAVDYRGRGGSDRDPDPSRYSVPVETADLLTLLDTLEIPDAVFVGTSRGGIVTMAAASARPGLVRAAVLNDIGTVIERRGLLRIKGYVGKLGDPRDLNEGAGILEGLFGAQFPNLRDRDWLAWAAATWETKAGRLVLSYDPALAATLEAVGPDTDIPDLWPLFEALKAVPVLLVRGERSDLLSAGTAEAMRQAHPGLDLVTVPDQGHTPLLGGPELLDPIRGFIDRALRQPRPVRQAPP
jgi:pimeloyl-ACP methyl ester carboxylesterase